MPRTLSMTEKLPMLCILAWSTTACISASAPKSDPALIGEAMYSPQPWVDSKPVNITARVSAIQGFASAVQTASNAYVEYQSAQADAFNRRQARQSALATQRYYARLQAEEDRLRAIRESEAAVRIVGQVRPTSLVTAPYVWDSSGWDLGVAIAGWVGMQDAQLRQMRVDINTNMTAPPPPPPPASTRPKK